MKTDPIGRNSYNGLGVPLFGESVIRQQNSSNAIVTLMHSTANTGRLLMGMNWKEVEADPSSLLTNIALFDIDEDGGFRGVSGTTINAELNSSGLFATNDTMQVVNSSREVAGSQQTVTISSDGTSAYTLLSANAGKLHIVSTQIGSSVVISLPTSATGLGIKAGMWWDVFSNTSAAGVIDIALIGLNTGGEIQCHHGSTNAIATTKAITHGTSGPFWARVFVDTTGAAPIYIIMNMMGTNGSTSLTYFDLVEGSSALS